MVTKGTPEAKTEGARALMSLAAAGDNQIAIAKQGGIAPLVALAKTGTTAQKDQAAGHCATLASLLRIVCRLYRRDASLRSWRWQGREEAQQRSTRRRHCGRLASACRSIAG